jgi:hypothetical protein
VFEYLGFGNKQNGTDGEAAHAPTSPLSCFLDQSNNQPDKHPGGRRHNSPRTHGCA